MSDVAPASARRQAWWLFGAALGLRLVVVALAAGRFPPADDGTFYHVVASRIAAGAGYTWAWPDGVVTFAAHYPVGYPALLGGAYWLLGSAPVAAMILNALLGALLVVAVHALALEITSLRRARWAGLLVALHPTLVLYTAALMTEAAAAAVLALLGALALQQRRWQRRWLWPLLGLGGGLLVLIRPQLLPVLPLLGAVAVAPSPALPAWGALLRRASGAIVVTALAVACCLPWTYRNCQKMDGCVFVSANGGWNLLIGTLPEGKGSFAPISGDTVPVECREVFGEAEKDRCFGRAGARRIAAEPGAWLALAPQKLGQLFDHGAVASSYLRTSNGALVSDQVKLALGAVETVVSRLLMLAASIALLRAAGSRVARWLALASGVCALSPWGGAAALALLGALALIGLEAGRSRALVGLAAAVLGLTIITHMVFFGAARYALVWLPWLVCLVVLPARSGEPAAAEAEPNAAPSG